MSIENIVAWVLVGLSLGIALVGFAVIVAVVFRRIAEHRAEVFKNAMKGGRR
jgi:hypothetical protein